MSDVVVPLRNRMTEAEYEAERQRLRDTYGDSSGEANGKREQELARLFARSGWTQEELAKKEGKSQTWIVTRLRFGRFLNFITNVINAESPPRNLTEGRFRKYWEKADACGGNERQRFALVAKAIQADVKGPTLPREHTDLARRIIDAFADSKWHDEQVIVDHFPDDDPAAVRQRLLSMQSVGMGSGRGTTKTRAERDKRGRGFRVRLFKPDRLISSAEISAKLRPLIEGLKEEGKKRMVTISIGAVARLAALLERQIDEWAQDPAADAASKEKNDE
jgi:hypothetical protein